MTKQTIYNVAITTPTSNHFCRSYSIEMRTLPCASMENHTMINIVKSVFLLKVTIYHPIMSYELDNSILRTQIDYNYPMGTKTIISTAIILATCALLL
jgi:hypothetical protein